MDEKDPSRLKYVNLLPNYASAKQLGTEGDPVYLKAYEEHIRRFVEVFKPQLLSYDHYHFAVKGDGDKYFLNLAQIRDASLKAGIPFMVIVQACSWTTKMRIPTGEEVRWLANTTLAYGSQGISYYVYGYPEHDGAMMYLVDGSPTPLYYFVEEVNREFVALAGELKSLKSIAVYHAGNAARRHNTASCRCALQTGASGPAQGVLAGQSRRRICHWLLWGGTISHPRTRRQSGLPHVPWRGPSQAGRVSGGRTTFLRWPWPT